LFLFLFLGDRDEQKKSSATERIEEDLARARSAIREAIRAQNSTSDEEEIYVPRGCVYRNAYAFHQLSVCLLMDIFFFLFFLR
jgi:xylogalacturonan beta-1,3-xylosyltransferase